MHIHVCMHTCIHTYIHTKGPLIGGALTILLKQVYLANQCVFSKSICIERVLGMNTSFNF